MVETDSTDFAALGAHLRAVAHPARLRILRLLREGERAFGELHAETSLAPNLLTHHLGALRRAGLVEAYRGATDRRVSFYALCPEHLIALGQVCVDLGASSSVLPPPAVELGTEGASAAGAVLGILASCGDAVVAVAPRRGITLWNTAAERLLGWRAADVVGRDCGAILRCTDSQGHPLYGTTCPLMACARRSQAVAAQDLRLSDATGAERWVSASTIAVSDGNGALRSLVHIFRDASRKMALERFTQAVQREATAVLNGVGAESSARGEVRTAPLTDREREVLVLLAEGADTSAIASHLCIGRSTARKHVQSILSKFGVHRRLEAIAHARRHGLLPHG